MSIVLMGSTSGSITLQEPAIAGNNTISVPAETGTMLVSGTQNIPKAALPTGSVLQVVNATTTTQTGNTSNVYADTTLTATITPTSSSSRILVIVHQNGLNKQTLNTGIGLRLFRNTTLLNTFGDNVATTTNTTENAVGGAGVCFLDSPATTSATTYKTQFCSTSNVSQAIVQHNNVMSYITLMEIAA